MTPLETSIALPAIDPLARIPIARRDWLRLMADLGIRPNKGLSQHFLFERGLVERMVRLAGVSERDTVLEIGPGLGILTSELLRKARSVVAVELDRTLAVHLRAAFDEVAGFRLVHGNALALTNDELIPSGEPFEVVANLPYSVGTAILRHQLEQPRKPRRLSVMLQKEVAERLTAQPPHMSVLGVATQFYAEPRLAFVVPPDAFIPPPKVESAVVILDVRETLPLPADLQPLFFTIVNAGFRQKRKQVANAIADVLRLPKAGIAAWLTTAGIDPMRRAETLSVAEWVTLTTSAPADVAAA
ncbi:MAG: 16S rRNA (adenine(1518)-N(6)/adenine(1519)-N(6))-dimethyltransferase RsmA [Chloroflexota bacterium]|nr:16S rRNA (adenine(1518)-N(6)/adenine(1519)-N(6))-dimethyltransferase RsmA [Chloroflexota bacterium]